VYCEFCIGAFSKSREDVIWKCYLRRETVDRQIIDGDQINTI
jgi:hypothetical protein